MGSKRGKSYPVPREGDNLGYPEELMYPLICRISSYDNDGFTYGGITDAPVTVSQVIFSIGWLESKLRLSTSVIRNALGRMKKKGLLIKLRDEGRSVGARYFLPQQYKIRIKINPLLELEDPQFVPEKQKNLAKNKEQETDRKQTGIAQEIIRKSTGKKAASRWDKAQLTTGKEQERNRKRTGKEQESNAPYNEVQSTKYKVQSTDDDDDYLTFTEKEFSNTSAREDEAYQQFQGQLDTQARIRQWYLEMEQTPDEFRAADEKLLQQWFEKYADYGFSLSDVARAFTEVSARVRPDKRINSLAYFEQEVFEAIKGRIDRRLA